MNGDQLQYEIDNKDVPPRERSDWPLPSFDAQDWSEAMAKRFNIPQEDLVPWCASMLMRGFDEHVRRAPSAGPNAKA